MREWSHQKIMNILKLIMNMSDRLVTKYDRLIGEPIPTPPVPLYGVPHPFRDSLSFFLYYTKIVAIPFLILLGLFLYIKRKRKQSKILVRLMIIVALVIFFILIMALAEWFGWINDYSGSLYWRMQ